MPAHCATERRTLEYALSRMPSAKADAAMVMGRVKRLRPMPPGAKVLDVGAAQGCVVVAYTMMGYDAQGVEFDQGARGVAAELAHREGVEMKILPGIAEKLPFPDESFDFVRANSVIEHVLDAQAAVNEACRVLKPGGVFWFYTASSMCPRQGEIAGFPLFGWYPDRLKRHIMEWAKTHKPHLVGFTKTPAINWFTPRKARRMLRTAGFTRVYDRWDLRAPTDMGALGRIALAVIRSGPVTKFLADLFVPDCSYAGVK